MRFETISFLKSRQFGWGWGWGPSGPGGNTGGEGGGGGGGNRGGGVSGNGGWCFWGVPGCINGNNGPGGSRPTTTSQTSTRPTSTRKITSTKTAAPTTTKVVASPTTKAASPIRTTPSPPNKSPAATPTPASPSHQNPSSPKATVPSAIDEASTTKDRGAGQQTGAPVPVPIPGQVSDSESGSGGDGVNSPSGTQNVGSGYYGYGNSNGQSWNSSPKPDSPSSSDPSATQGTGTNGGKPGVPTISIGANNGTSSSGGLGAKAVAGIVVGLLLLFLLVLAILLYKFRKSPQVQRVLSSVRGKSSHPYVSMPDGMDHNLLGGSAAIDGASGTAAGVAASAAGAAVASSAYHRDLPSPSPVQPMQQAPVSRPLVVPIVPTRPDNRRISVFTSDTGMTGSAFTPSSVSPNSTNFNMLPVPGMARTAKPQQAPPDPPVGRSANARFSVDSMSSVSTSSCVTAALSPGQMAWPMPPGTPPAIRHPGGPQYIDFEQTGRTVVRINLPPCGHRPGY